MHILDRIVIFADLLRDTSRQKFTEAFALPFCLSESGESCCAYCGAATAIAGTSRAARAPASPIGVIEVL
jgi:hypothetical protein